MFCDLLIRRVSRRVLGLPEVVQRDEIHRPVISDYLEGLVRRGLVPRPIAEVINNRCPDEQVQREAVSLFWAKQRAKAWEERRRRSRRLRVTLKTVGCSMAGLCAVIFIKEARSSQPAVPSMPWPIPVIQVHPRVENPRPPAAVVRPPKTAIKRAKPAAHRRAAKISAAVPAVHSTVPMNLAINSRGKDVRFSWDSMGPGYTYTLYSADNPAMSNLRKEKDGISGTAYTMSFRDALKSGSWWVISATNEFGGESPLSGAVNYSP